MRILFICQYYYPEPFMHHDYCRELVKRGHEVFVVTGVPNYPMGKIYDGYKDKEHIDEIIDGVKIHRCFTVPRKTGPVFRVLNYYSFAVFSALYVRHLKKDFDVVFINQLSPVIMAKAGMTYGKKFNKPVVLYCLDIWPESLLAGGFTKKSPVYKYIHRISQIVYSKVNKIFVPSPDFSSYLEREFGIKDTVYLPRYAEDFFTPDNCKKPADGKTDIMFAGNIGTVQGLDTLIKAVSLLSNIDNLYLHIVGEGSELEHIKRMSADMPNVIFHGRKSAEEMPKYYSLADAMIVVLKSGELNATLPGKVQTYLAAGKPVIASADGVTRDTVSAAKCGFCSTADDVTALAENIKRFIASNKAELSKNARAYYDTHFSKQTFISTLENELENTL